MAGLQKKTAHIDSEMRLVALSAYSRMVDPFLPLPCSDLNPCASKAPPHIEINKKMFLLNFCLIHRISLNVF